MSSLIGRVCLSSFAALTLLHAAPSFAQSCPEAKDPAKIELRFGVGSMRAAFSQGVIVQGSNGELYLSVEFSAESQKLSTRPPLNLSIVIDRSGSMSGDKIESAKEAAAGMIENLGAADTVSLVQYDNNAQVLVPATKADAAGKALLMAAVETITPGGGTNLHDGLALGIEEARSQTKSGQASRVILLSDGRANAGIVDPNELAMDASAAAESGIHVTTVGLGLDYHEDLMEEIALSGAGNYYYVKGAEDLEPVFAGELRDLQDTVATKAELRLDPACAGIEILEVYGYRFTRDGSSVVVPIPDLVGGATRKVVLKLRAPADKVSASSILKTTFAFQDTAGARQEASSSLGLAVSKDKKAARASVDKDVMAKATQIESARALKEAAAAYDSGDTSGAQAKLKEAREKTASAAKTYNFDDDAIQGELQAADEAFRAPAPSASHKKDAVKRSKSVALEAMH